MKTLILAFLAITQVAFAAPERKTIVMCDLMKDSITFKTMMVSHPIYPPKPAMEYAEVFVNGKSEFMGPVSRIGNTTSIEGGKNGFEELKMVDVGNGLYNVKLSYYDGSLFVGQTHQGCRLIKEVTGGSAHN